MYTTTNYATKKALKEAVASDSETVTVWQHNQMFGALPTNGTIYLEGPHYPKPHSWYAQATLRNGVVVAVK